jgi:prevent-host-death family protein
MTTVTLSDAKARLAQLLKDVQQLGESVLITRSGKPAGVLLSAEEYEGLIETLEILADEELSQAIRSGLRDVEAGRVVDHEEVWSAVAPALRE